MTFALPPRSTKPRTRGLTSMIDFGPDTFGWTGAPEGIRNLLAACADYIDYAKIYALNALLMPRETVKAAAHTYRDFGVTTRRPGKTAARARDRRPRDFGKLREPHA